MNQPLPSFLSKELKTMSEQPSPTNVDIAARARTGAEAVDALIKERDHHADRASNLARHYDTHRAQIEQLERQNSLLDAKLTYYQNLSTSLLTRLSTISMSVEDAMRESREAAARGDSLHTSRPGQPSARIPNGQVIPVLPGTNLQAVDQKRLEDLAKRLAPEAQEPMDLPK